MDRIGLEVERPMARVAAVLASLIILVSPSTAHAAVLENPAPASVQSGLGVVSGWKCAASKISAVVDLPDNVVFDGDIANLPAGIVAYEVPYGGSRRDTTTICGDADNSFALLLNWALLGDGEHVVRMFDGSEEFARSTFRVTTLGGRFVRGVSRELRVDDFPVSGQNRLLRWDEATQHFGLASAVASQERSGTMAGETLLAASDALLENPVAGSTQSGIGVVSGWKCSANQIYAIFDLPDGVPFSGSLDSLPPQAKGYGVPYGGSRKDTAAVCGDVRNSFALLLNWSLLGAGAHTVRLFDGAAEFARSSFVVETLGVPFLRGVTRSASVVDFPQPGERVELAWQESAQGFVATSFQRANSSQSPSTPRLVVVSAADPQSLRLVWEPAVDDTTPANQIRYEVHASTVEGVPAGPATLRQVVTGGLVTDVTGLSAGARLGVLVVAVDRDGHSSDRRAWTYVKLPQVPTEIDPAATLETSQDLLLPPAAVAGDTLRFPGAAGQSAPSVGSFLIAEATDGGGVLAKVAAVGTSGGDLLVQTRPASLSDFVSSASLASTQALPDLDRVASAIKRGTPGGPVVQAARSTLADGSPTIEVAWPGDVVHATQIEHRSEDDDHLLEPGASAGDFRLVARPSGVTGGLTYDAQVSFEPELRVAADWRHLPKLEFLSGEVVAIGTLGVDTGVDLDLEDGAVIDTGQVELASRTFLSRYVVGGVPVYQETTLRLSVQGTARASAKVHASASAGARASLEVGVRYDANSRTWQPVLGNSIEREVNLELDVGGGASATLSVIPELEVRFYRVVAARLAIEPELTTSLAASLHGPEACSRFQVDEADALLSIECRASVSLDVFFDTIPLLSEQRICGPWRYTLAGLDRYSLAEVGGSGERHVLGAILDDRPWDEIAQASLTWSVDPPAAGTITPQASPLEASLTCKQTRAAWVRLSSEGRLGAVARRCVAYPVSCVVSSATPAPTSSPTSTPRPTPVPSPTRSPVPTVTPRPSVVPTVTPGPTGRPTVTPGPTLTPSLTPSPFPTPTNAQTIPPSVPTGTSPGSTSSPGPTLSGTSVTLSWNGSSGATYYDLGVRDESTGVLVVDTQTTATSYFASLASGRPYRWNVAACNAAGCSSYSTRLYFRTP